MGKAESVTAPGGITALKQARVGKTEKLKRKRQACKMQCKLDDSQGQS